MSKRHQQRVPFACGIKRPYLSEDEAQRTATMLSRSAGQPLFVYLCRSCTTYHLTRDAR